MLSLPNDLDQRALTAQAVEFAVEDLFPRAEIEFALRDRDHDLAAHDGALEVGVGIVFRTVVFVLGVGLFRCELFQPDFEILMQAGLIVVDENGGGDVHGIDQAQALFDAALAQGGFHLRGDVDELPAFRHFEPKLFPKGFHAPILQQGPRRRKNSERRRSTAQGFALVIFHFAGGRESGHFLDEFLAIVCAERLKAANEIGFFVDELRLFRPSDEHGNGQG